jgi:hypothetical protein
MLCPHGISVLPLQTSVHCLINGILGKWLGKSHILEQLHTNLRWSLNIWGDGMTAKVVWHVVKEYADSISEDERSAS